MPDWVTIIGAGYGAVQAIAQLMVLVLPSNTVAWKFFKYLISGPARQYASSGVPPVLR